MINSGEIQNDGWEIGLNGSPVAKVDGINWNIGVNFTKINSMIIDAGEGGDIILSAAGSNSSSPTNNIHRTESHMVKFTERDLLEALMVLC